MNNAARNLGVLTAIVTATTLAAAGPARADQPAQLPIKPVASPMEDQRAMDAFNTQFGTATAVGGFGGTVAGALIGCALGGIVTSPTVVFVPVGCATGAATGAAVGGVIGTIVVGGPALAVAGNDLVQTLTAAPGTTKWAQ